MKLSIKKGSENYTATVVRIKNLYKIEGADKIVRTNVYGNDVVVSNSTKTGDMFLYFCSGTKLNPEFCRKNNLYSNADLNEDTLQKGYLSHTGRVKAIKLKNVISDGLLLPLTSLSYLNVPLNLKEEDSFTDIEGVSICEKYKLPTKEIVIKDKTPKVKLKNLLIPKQLKFHYQTEHLLRNLDKIGTKVVVTRKLHGSSGLLGNLLIIRKLSFFEKLLNKLNFNIPTKEYGFIYSSGKPKSETPKGIISDSLNWKTGNQSFYNNDIWYRAYEFLKDKTEKGITLYFEIVGEGIQGKEYTYNFDFHVFVYRITYTNPDGFSYEFSWEDVKRYCKKYDIDYVTEYETTWFNSKEEMVEGLQKYLNKSYPDCKIDEGICIRDLDTHQIFKMKSPNFIKMESDIQEKGETNLEDNQ